MTQGIAAVTAGRRGGWPDQAPERDLEMDGQPFVWAGIQVQNCEDSPDSGRVSDPEGSRAPSAREIPAHGLDVTDTQC